MAAVSDESPLCARSSHGSEGLVHHKWHNRQAIDCRNSCELPHMSTAPQADKHLGDPAGAEVNSLQPWQAAVAAWASHSRWSHVRWRERCASWFSRSYSLLVRPCFQALVRKRATLKEIPIGPAMTMPILPKTTPPDVSSPVVWRTTSAALGHSTSTILAAG